MNNNEIKIPPIFLEGKITYLRPLLKSDFRPEYLVWLNNNELNVYSDHFRTWPTIEKDQESFFENIKGPNHIHMAACCKKTNKHFGNVGLINIDWINSRAEHVLYIGLPKFRMTHYIDILQILAYYTFNILNLNKIYGGTEILKMIDLQKRLGWRKEGVLRKHNYRNGEYVDVIQTALLREDYKKII